MHKREHPVYFGQIMLFKECREAEENQALLARAALVLGACEIDVAVDLQAMIKRPHWDQYQALLNVMELHANTAVRWSEQEKKDLRGWAEADGSAYAPKIDTSIPEIP